MSVERTECVLLHTAVRAVGQALDGAVPVQVDIAHVGGDEGVTVAAERCRCSAQEMAPDEAGDTARPTHAASGVTLQVRVRHREAEVGKLGGAQAGVASHRVHEEAADAGVGAVALVVAADLVASAPALEGGGPVGAIGGEEGESLVVVDGESALDALDGEDLFADDGKVVCCTLGDDGACVGRGDESEAQEASGELHCGWI